MEETDDYHEAVIVGSGGGDGLANFSFGANKSFAKSVQKIFGQKIAEIVDTCEGNVIEELRALSDGIVFFQHNKPLVYANTAIIKILPG